MDCPDVYNRDDLLSDLFHFPPSLRLPWARIDYPDVYNRDDFLLDLLHPALAGVFFDRLHTDIRSRTLEG
jgi:hypothetical protein